MKYSELCRVYSKLEATASKLKKTSIMAGFLKRCDGEHLEVVPLLLTGQVFPEWGEKELGVGSSLLYESMSFVAGVESDEMERLVAKEGDPGRVAENIAGKRMQRVLLEKEMTLLQVYGSFEKIARASGTGSQAKKVRYLAELLSSASPMEAKYIVKTVLGKLRAGAAEGLVRDAIAQAFNVDVGKVERAFMLANHFGPVAKAASRGEGALEEIRMNVFVPIRPMLAQVAPNPEAAMKHLEKAALEIKYDGARVQVHKRGGEIKIFSRRLENVTGALPDIVELAGGPIRAEEVILDGEVVAIDTKTSMPRAFQHILRRFRRKYAIDEMLEKIPFETYIFDVMFYGNRETIDLPFEERRKIIEEIIEPAGKFGLSHHLVTTSLEEASRFYNLALDSGHEGVMVKNLGAPYIPNARVGYMYKIKPVGESPGILV